MFCISVLKFFGLFPTSTSLTACGTATDRDLELAIALNHARAKNCAKAHACARAKNCAQQKTTYKGGFNFYKIK